MLTVPAHYNQIVVVLEAVLSLYASAFNLRGAQMWLNFLLSGRIRIVITISWSNCCSHDHDHGFLSSPYSSAPCSNDLLHDDGDDGDGDDGDVYGPLQAGIALLLLLHTVDGRNLASLS